MLEPVDWQDPDPEELPTSDWQFERIDPEKGVRDRVIYGVPLLLFVALLSLGVLGALLLIPVITAIDAETPIFSLLTPAHLFLTGLLVLCAIPLTLGLVASVRRLTTPAPWLQVEALCYKRDIQPIANDGELGAGYDYSYRLLCRFEYDYASYEATPEGTAEPEPCLFPTEEAAAEFLDQYLTEDGRARLWINTRNPLEANLTGPPEDT